MSATCGYRQLDHTADLALEIWAPSEPRLLEQAAVAVMELLTDTARLRKNDTRFVELTALDPADRLVRWMNEVLTLAVLDGFLTVTAAIELEGERGLRARLDGQAQAHDRLVTELKCVTYHDLALNATDARWRARVVIDV